MCADAVAFARSIGYVNAGTVEFLLGEDGRYVFIEMNPRIQVEHTVTEEVTDIDLVVMQMQIASGDTFADMGLRQEDIHTKGFALQCRITTEDPSNGFRPDAGTITVYRSAGGSGVRLDGGTVFVGAEVSAHFDSMLVKLTCRASTFPLAVRRARRALAEFRIRGVSTNIPFLEAVLADPVFQDGLATTSFIDQRPGLLSARVPADRATKLLSYLADVTVNQPHGPVRTRVRPRLKLPPLPTTPVPEGARDRLLAQGPAAFARDLRQATGVLVTDTTFRDAHQSLLATRMRTRDLLHVASHVSHLTPQLLSMEAWGGATYDVALRFLAEDPWERLAALREAMPNIPLQMLLRGRNTVGYTPYPTAVTDAFVREAATTGLDIFRIFDSLNDVSQMRPAVEAVLATDTAVAEVALCYTGNLMSPGERLYTLDYYLRLAEQIVDTGAHVLAIKDMAGLLRAPAAARLVRALRERFDLPVHLHTHDTAGGQIGTLLAAIDAGVDAVDAATATMAGTTSQPSLSALVAATDDTDARDRPRHRQRLRPRALLGGGAQPLPAVRVRPRLPHRSGLRPRDPRRPAVQPPPAGDRARSRRPLRGHRGHVCRRQPDPRQHRQGDAEQQGRRRPRPGPRRCGRRPGRLRGRTRSPTTSPSRSSASSTASSATRPAAGPSRSAPRRSPAAGPEPRLTALSRRAGGRPREPTRAGPSTSCSSPDPTKDFDASRESYGDLSALGTVEFLHGLEQGEEYEVEIEPGKRLLLGVSSIGDVDPKGMRTVMCTLNGQFRPIQVRDRSVKAEVMSAEKAEAGAPGQVAAPFAGVVTSGRRRG